MSGLLLTTYPQTAIPISTLLCTHSHRKASLPSHDITKIHQQEQAATEICQHQALLLKRTRPFCQFNPKWKKRKCPLHRSPCKKLTPPSVGARIRSLSRMQILTVKFEQSPSPVHPSSSSKRTGYPWYDCRQIFWLYTVDVLNYRTKALITACVKEMSASPVLPSRSTSA